MPDFDSEAAARSWRDAPDNHVLQAMKQIDNYEPAARDIIIAESQRRFGHTIEPQAVRVSIQIDVPRMPGIGRASYFSLFLLALIFAACILAAFNHNKAVSVALKITMYLVLIALTYARFRNIGWKGYLALLAAIPFFNLFVVFSGWILPEGYQRTKSLDRASVIVAALCLGFLVFFLLALFS